MTNIKTTSVALLGLLLIIVGVGLWVSGDTTNTVVNLPLATTGIPWAPMIWVLGIIIMLSAALANTLHVKHYLLWLLVLIVGYLGVFAVLVGVASLILP